MRGCGESMRTLHIIPASCASGKSALTAASQVRSRERRTRLDIHTS